MNVKEVKQFLKQRNLQPIKRFGQNFLTDEAIISTLVHQIQKLPAPFVEVGPGLGALSQHFEDKKKEIVLIERDKKLVAYWKEQGYSVFSADALKLDWDLLPKRFTLFGNLPYEIVASLILKSCLQQKKISNIIFMIQKEVAQRVQAKPYSEDYGLLSVMSQVFWNISFVLDVPKGAFYPIPKVNGRVLAFQAKPQRAHFDANLFLKFVKKSFSFRRKMLFKQLQISSEQGKKLLKEIGLGETCRAQELSPEQFIELYFAINDL